ncbi:hypothetical protein F5Y10DRAFT_48223 [Nemania abortiva]|nr:hypothetical protein F5Y10DRAFT_48223 [Nemania abortiva]
MFTLLPYLEHQTATQPMDASPEAITSNQLYGKTSYLNMDLSKARKMPIALPNPPRPPTPGPPRPYPPVPPPHPVPTPPPSPQYLLFCGFGPQLSILVSRAEPFQYPIPNPPPSPGPRRPGPRNPRPGPDVPTPPPSPRRSISPWIFSTASDLIVFVLGYLSSATWDASTAYEYVRMASEDSTCSGRHSDSPVAKLPIIMPGLTKSPCKQIHSEIAHGPAASRELY